MANELMLLGCGPAGADGASSYLLRDTFTDADGTSLASHTMDVGSGWTASGGTWQVQSNQARKVSGTGGHDTLTADAGRADVNVSVEMTPDAFSGGNLFGGLILRRTDDNNQWLFQITSGGTYRLFEKNGGGYTQRASADAAALVEDQVYTLTASLSGTTISCTLGPNTPIEYGSATHNQSATQFGVESEIGTINWDNFEVTAP